VTRTGEGTTGHDLYTIHEGLFVNNEPTRIFGSLDGHIFIRNFNATEELVRTKTGFCSNALEQPYFQNQSGIRTQTIDMDGSRRRQTRNFASDQNAARFDAKYRQPNRSSQRAGHFFEPTMTNEMLF
jgi:hypothetical protein